MIGTLRRHRQTVQLARQPVGEVADVDHFLHLALPLGKDLAHLQRHQGAEVVLLLAQRIAEPANEVTAARRRDPAPFEKRRLGAANYLIVLVLGDLNDGTDLGTVGRGENLKLGSRTDPLAGKPAEVGVVEPEGSEYVYSFSNLTHRPTP